MTDHHRADTEAHLVGAMRGYPTGTPDLDHLSTHAVRNGTRVRRRRQGAAVVASVALVGAASFGVTALWPGDQPSSVPFSTATPLATETPTESPTVYSPGGPVFPDGADPADYGLPVVFEAVPVAPAARYPGDKVRFYSCVCSSSQRVTLNLRPADTFSDYDLSNAPRTAVIDGDPAWIVRDEGIPTVVGPVRDGAFLTLSGAGLTDTELTDLAALLRRTRGDGTS